MSQKENPELVNQRTVSYPIVWEPWEILGIAQNDYPSVPFTQGSHDIDWVPSGGRIYEALSAQPYSKSLIRNASENYVKYNFPEPLRIPVGRPGKSVIELTLHFKKANENTPYDDSVRTFSIGAAGAGYQIGDYIRISAAVAGAADAIFLITQTTPTGGLTPGGLSMVQPGYGHSAGVYPVLKIPNSPPGAGGTINIIDIQSIPAWDRYHWALIQDEEIFPLRRDYEDATGVYFWPVEISLERYQTDFNPSLAWLRDQNTNSTGTQGLNSRNHPYNYQWYLINTHYVSVIIDYKVTFLPEGSLENGDIQDVPITMASITRMIGTRDRKRDKKKGREVTPVKDLLRKAGGDLRRRREINRPLTNAF